MNNLRSGYMHHVIDLAAAGNVLAEMNGYGMAARITARGITESEKLDANVLASMVGQGDLVVVLDQRDNGGALVYDLTDQARALVKDRGHVWGDPQYDGGPRWCVECGQSYANYEFREGWCRGW